MKKSSAFILLLFIFLQPAHKTRTQKAVLHQPMLQKLTQQHSSLLTLKSNWCTTAL